MRRQPTREWAVSMGLATMVAAIVLTLPTSALAEVEIAHDGVDCVVAGQFPVIQARLQPSGEVARARVYFHARGTPDWYFVEMKSEGGAAFEGTLPQPLDTLDGLEYYIETVATGFVQDRSREFSARVITGSESCPAGRRTATAMGSVPSALLVGAPEGAPALPPGFADIGLVGASGAGAPGAGAAAGTSGGGISTGALLGIAAGAGAAVAVAVAAGGDEGVASPAAAAGTAAGGMPEPTPTPTPAPDVSGRWAGTFDEIPSATQCSVQNDLALDLQQSGSAVSGTFQLLIRSATPAPSDPCPVQAGDAFTGLCSGTVNGDTISLQLAITGGPSFFLGGTISGDRMGGSSPPDSGGPGGSWEVNRQ